MDPVTRAAKAFLAASDAFWKAGRGPLLPMFAGWSERADLVKALRLRELEADNRWPLFLYEAPFLDTRSYHEGLSAAIGEGYEEIRRGVAEEGVTLPPFALPPLPSDRAHTPLARAVIAAERAAALLGEVLSGAWVALVPARIDDAEAFREAVMTLQRARLSPRLRLAVFLAPEHRPIELRDGARFEVDQGELLAFLEQLGPGRSEGPATEAPPAPTEAQRRAFREATGRELPAPGTAAQLRAHLLAAGRHSAALQHVDAAARYSQARALCQRDGLVLEEAMVLLALAGACLASGETRLAVDGYEQAAKLAASKEAYPLVCQARLGAGAVHLSTRRHEAAAVAYHAAAAAAERGQAVVLHIEALRMEGTCLLLLGSKEGAIRVWQEAVTAGASLERPERDLTTLSRVSEALIALLGRLGLTAQAEHVRGLLAAGVAKDDPVDSAAPTTLPLARVVDDGSRSSGEGATPLPPPATATFAPLRVEGPVLPFKAGESALRRGSEQRIERSHPDDDPGSARTTAEFPPLRPGAPALPFAAPAPSAPAAGEPASGDAEEETVDIPVDQAPVGLTLEQYASLCAESLVFPAHTGRILARYGITSVRERTLWEQTWLQRIRSNEADARAWESLYARYRAYWSEVAARGLGPGKG